MSVWTCATCPVSSWIIDLFLRFDYAYSIRYCGFHNITPLARTLTNQLEMKFVSDSRLSSRGFEMRYGAIESKFSMSIKIPIEITEKNKKN